MEARRFFRNLRGPVTPSDIDSPKDASLPNSQAKDASQIENWEDEGGKSASSRSTISST